MQIGTSLSKLRKVLLICGILAALVQIGTDIVGGMVYPDYSFISQAISELTAIDAPTRTLLVPFAPIYGTFQIAFGFGNWLLAGHRRVLRILAVTLIPPFHR